MKTLSRLALIITVITSLLAVLPGCERLGSGVTTTKPADTKLAPYKIGAVFAVTGNNSPLGTPEKQTVEMLVEDINAKGGINGHPLEAVIYDTQSDTTQCVTLVKKLIEQDQVLAIIGPSSSGESLAILDTITKAEIPLISCAASSQITSPVADRKWIFKTAQSDILAVQQILYYLQKTGVRKVGLLCDSAGFGQTGHTVLLDEVPKAGITIVADEKFNTNDADMTTQLTKIKAAGAETVICWGTNPGPAVVAKNMKQLNMTIPLVNSHGIANQAFIDLAGDAANGVVFPAGKLLVANQLAASELQRDILISYRDEFEKKYGVNTAVPYGGHAYDAVQMLYAALKEAGPDKALIRNYLETKITRFPAIGGVFYYSVNDHAGLDKDAFVMIKIVDGKWTWFWSWMQ